MMMLVDEGGAQAGALCSVQQVKEDVTHLSSPHVAIQLLYGRDAWQTLHSVPVQPYR